MKKVIILGVFILLSVYFVPSVTFASWWNPLSWKVFNIAQHQTATVGNSPYTFSNTATVGVTSPNTLLPINTTAITVGSTNTSAVTTLQNNLTSAGYTLTADGKFGAQTLNAVTSIQTKYGLPVNGIVDTATLSAINTALSAKSATSPTSTSASVNPYSTSASTNPYTTTKTTTTTTNPYATSKNSSVLPSSPNTNVPATGGNYAPNIPVNPNTKVSRSCYSTTAPWIDVISPNGGESYKSGQDLYITWQTCNIVKNPNTQLDIMDDRIIGWITKSLFGSAPALNYAKLVSSIGNVYTYTYKIVVPKNFDNSLPTKYKGIFGGQHYKANISIKLGSSKIMSDDSDNFFSILPTTTPTINGVIIFEEQNAGDILSVDHSYSGPDTRWKVDREKLLEQFYQIYKDKYDFIALFPDKSLVYNYSTPVNRNIAGIGAYTAIGSYTNKLKVLAVEDFYPMWQINPSFKNDYSLKTLVHEIGHYWLVYINGLTQNGDGMHWANNLDLFNGDSRYVDIMGYSQWVKKSDNTYICIDGNSASTIGKFSNLSLYLMGLIPASEVRSISVHEFNNKPNDLHYNTWGPGCSDSPAFTATKTVTIQDIVKINGERNPTYESAQKNFSVAFVILKSKGDVLPSGFIDYINEYKNALPVAWSEATSGKSIISLP